MSSIENRLSKFDREPRKEIAEIRSRAILLCPDNDPEAHLILKLAEKAGFSVIRSEQPHGANLDSETDLELKLAEFKKPEIWVVETPGLEKERALENQGLKVKIIDHHTYKDLDRLTDPETGKKKPSSLEQFLAMAKINDEEIRAWGWDPKSVRGIGILDAKYVRGLREAGYSKEDIDKVFELKQQFIKEIQPEFYELLKLAEEYWGNRIERSGYLVIVSQHGGDMRSAISEMSIIKDMDTVPLVISVDNGEKISVQNVASEIIEKLNQNIKGNTYTFGSGGCWGVNNKNQNKVVTLEEILQVLEK